MLVAIWQIGVKDEFCLLTDYIYIYIIETCVLIPTTGMTFFGNFWSKNTEFLFEIL